MQRRGHPGRELEGRGVARPARDQLPLRGRGDDGRQPRRLQERRQGDRAPERLLDHVHGEARPHVDRQLVPHPLEPLARRRERVRRRVGRLRAATSPARSRASRELAVFVAPTINSYKRFAAGSWAPTTLAWGHDNRTCGFRIVGHGAALRTETRIPGGDVNPYLAFAALLAAGPARDRARARAAAAARGERVRVGRRALPARAARGDRARSRAATMARAALGDDVVDHYLNYARTEQRLFDEVVTCYERERMLRARMRAASSASHVRRARRRWGVLEVERGADPARRTCTRSSARRAAAARAARARTRSRRRSTRSTGIDLLRRRRPRPDALRRRAAPGDRRRPSRSATARSSRCSTAALDARHAGARDLPRLAGAERRARRRPRPAPARRSSAHERHKHTPGVFADHDVAVAPDSRLGGAARRARAGEVAPPPGLRAASATGLRRGRLGRGRHGRGARGSGEALRARRALAPGGGRGHRALRGARRGGARYRAERRG